MASPAHRTTTTTTIQLTQNQPAPVILRLHGAPQTPDGKLKWLLEDIAKACADLDSPYREEMQQFLKIWEAKFFTQYKELATDEEKMEFVFLLGELYFKIAETPTTENFCAQLKQVLLNFAPEDCNSELFLEGYKLKVLIQDMKGSSDTLPPEYVEGMLELFTEWEVQFFQQFMGSAATDEEKIQAGKLFGALYCRVEKLMLYVVKEESAQVYWSEICNRLKERLAEILPPQLPLEKFLTRYRRVNKIFELNKHFERIRDELYQQANSVNEELQMGFNKIQQEMILLQKATDLTTEQIYEKVDALTASVTQLYVNYGVHMDDMKNIAGLLQRQASTSRNILNETNRVLHKV